MAKWSSRSGLYKTALGLTYFVFLVYGLAFGTPSWIGIDSIPAGTGVATDRVGRTQFQGLWVRCIGSDEGDFEDCSEQSFGDDWDWMDGVRGCWIGGMFFFLVGVFYSLLENCCGDEDSKDYGLTGTLILLSGLCGAAGVIVTTVNMEDVDTHGYKDYYWGFILACIASGLAILLAIILLIARNARPSDYDDDDDKNRYGNSRAIDYINNYGKQPYTGGYGGGYGGSPYEYHNAGYRGDLPGGPGPYPHQSHQAGQPPLGNGVGYHHQGNASHPYTVYQGNTSSLPRPNGGYYPGGAPGLRHSMAESADLSNGFTQGIIQAEQNMSRHAGRGDFYVNGRPY